MQWKVDNDEMQWVWQGRIGKCDPNSEKLESSMDQQPQAGGPFRIGPISKNEGGIKWCVWLRLTAYELFLGKLKAAKDKSWIQISSSTALSWICRFLSWSDIVQKKSGKF